MTYRIFLYTFESWRLWLSSGCRGSCHSRLMRVLMALASRERRPREAIRLARIFCVESIVGAEISLMALADVDDEDADAIDANMGALVL